MSPFIGYLTQSGQHWNHIHTNNKDGIGRLHIYIQVTTITKEKESINLRVGRMKWIEGSVPMRGWREENEGLENDIILFKNFLNGKIKVLQQSNK